MENKNLNSLSEREKDALLGTIYSKVKVSTSGILIINTKYCRMCAEMLVGNYEKLTKFGKVLFRSDITGNYIDTNSGFTKYINYK